MSKIKSFFDILIASLAVNFLAAIYDNDDSKIVSKEGWSMLNNNYKKELI